MNENKNEKKSSRFKLFFSKIKNIKGFEIAIVIVLVCVMLLIAFSTFSKKDKVENKLTTSNSLEEYCANLEQKLNAVLSQIEGAGNISSMITLEGGYEQKLAYMEDKSITNGEKSGTTTNNSTTSQSVVYITKDGVETPLVLYEQCPKIAGVVIVSSGAKDVKVKLDIIRAVSTLLNCDVSCIEVLSGK